MWIDWCILFTFSLFKLLTSEYSAILLKSMKHSNLKDVASETYLPSRCQFEVLREKMDLWIAPYKAHLLPLINNRAVCEIVYLNYHCAKIQNTQYLGVLGIPSGTSNLICFSKQAVISLHRKVEMAFSI